MNIPEEWKNFSKYMVEEILEEVGDGVPLRLPIPIKEVINSYLGDVNFVVAPFDYDFPEGVSAFTKKDMGLGWLIVINGKECIERQRFSAAHEMGHIVLFQSHPEKVYCSNDSSWDEKLCDRFAGDILMPEKVVRKLYETNPSPFLDDIAKKFKVSRLVAEIQLNHLGLPFKRIAVSF